MAEELEGCVAVAVTGAPTAEEVIRSAARNATRSHAGLFGIYVRPPANDRHVEAIERARRLLEDLGGTYREVTGTDVAATLVDAARGAGAAQLVVGASRRTRFRELVSGSVISDVVRRAGATLDVHIVGGGTTALGVHLGRGHGLEMLPARRRRAGWLIVVAGLPLLTFALTALGSGVELSSVLLLYLLVVLVAAGVGGPWPAAVGAVSAFAIANWYFTPPLRQWKVSRAEDLVALVSFIVVAAVVGGLVVHAGRRQVESARSRTTARTLAAMSGASVAHDPLTVLVDQLRDAFHLEGVAVIKAADGHVEASAGTAPSPAAPPVELPLGEHHRLVIRGGPLSGDDRAILAVFADHLTAALTTRRLQTEAAGAAALSEANAFRTAILAAVSHDLRTPLASIKASVTSLRQHDVAWSPAAVAEFLATIDEETDRLNGLIGNLLDLSRLQTDTLQILVSDIGLEEVTPAAISSLGELGRRVDSDVGETLPRVRVDPGLLERALANIVANAIAWSPSDERVRIDAVQVADRIDLRVADHGPGIPLDARTRVFEPFQRLGDRGTDGVGLGLAVARGFVTAMAGEVTVEDTPGGGTTMVVSLPVAP